MLTHERLVELLNYDPLTGVFTWKPFARKNRNKCGVAGTPTSKGYLQITIDYRVYLAHRLAWFYMFQEWPKKIDHQDQIKSHNHIENLREATGTQNNGNTSTTAGNKTGYRGVFPFGLKFASYIRFEGRVIYLGMFPDPHLAHEAYKNKHLELHGEFSIYSKEIA